MGQIFISYSRNDRAFVDRLIADLEKSNVDIWMDRIDIRGGEKWAAAIAQAIHGCDAFIVVLSTQAVLSDNVGKELSIACSHKRLIIPLRLDACNIPPQMEYQLTDLQWIDLIAKPYPEALNELVQTLRPESPVPPVPVPDPHPTSLVQILPGAWQINITSQTTGMSGQLNLQVFPTGLFQGQLMTPMGAFIVEGQWQVIPPDQLSFQGQQTNGFQVAPYFGSIRFSQITPNQLQGISAQEEIVFWQRIA